MKDNAQKHTQVTRYVAEKATWKLESDGPIGCKEFYIVDDSGRRIATLNRMDIGPRELQLNARLIAEAPDMLAALKSILPLFQYLPSNEHPEEAMVVNAIAKAELVTS